MESYQIKGVIKDHARAVKDACLKIISGELSLADKDMFLRAIIANMEKLAEFAEKEISAA